jgi:hypothetical protein
LAQAVCFCLLSIAQGQALCQHLLRGWLFSLCRNRFQI